MITNSVNLALSTSFTGSRGGCDIKIYFVVIAIIAN